MSSTFPNAEPNSTGFTPINITIEGGAPRRHISPRIAKSSRDEESAPDPETAASSDKNETTNKSRNSADDTVMVDAENEYGEGDDLNDGAYYASSAQKTLQASVAKMNLRNASDDGSPTQPNSGDTSSAAVTPRSKRVLVKSGKKKKTVEFVEEPAAEDEEEDDFEAGDELDDDKDEDFSPEEPEPVIPKKTTRAAVKSTTPKATPNRKIATPKSRKSTSSTKTSATSKSPAKTPTKPRKNARKSTAKVKDALPFNRQRRAPKNGINESKQIPRSYEECDDADKALIDMREKDRKTWKDIRGAWEEMTGQKTGTSTLPNRYERLKDNFSIIREEDRSRLLEAKDEVEREMQARKWGLIAEKVVQSGGNTYTPDNLQRQYKKMMVKEGLRPPPGVVDPDFNIAISDDDDGIDETAVMEDDDGDDVSDSDDD